MNVPKPTKGPRSLAAEAWMAQAKKGETFEYFRGPDIHRVLMTPEQRMTKAERNARQTKIEMERYRAETDGKKFKPPPIHDEFADIKPDIMALVDLVGDWELRGLIELRTIVLGQQRSYEMVMLIQRNGLKGVRAREGVSSGAA